MGKTLISKCSETMLKHSVKVRIKKAANKLDSAKRHSSFIEGEPLSKKSKPNEDIIVTDFNNLFNDDEQGKNLVKREENNYYLYTECKTDHFFTDEVNTTFLKNELCDFYFDIVEEIALEGLDGITLEG